MKTQHIGCSLFIGIVFVLTPYSASAKPPKPGPGGTCIVSTKCTNSIDATCAQLYCKALRKDCKGHYGSGACKDIKDLHEKGMCSLAQKDCGRTLPIILTIGGFAIEVDGDEQSVLVNPNAVDDKDSGRFKATINGAAKAIKATERKGGPSNLYGK